MKNSAVSIFTLLMSVLLLCTYDSNAQFNVPKKIKQHSQRTFDQTTDRAADKGIDPAYDKEDNGAGDMAENEREAQFSDEEVTSSGPQKEEPLRAYSKYNFVPGDVVIFEDNLANEENGEFPSKWDLKTGNVEIARYGNEKVINFPDVSWARIVPLMAEKGDYLPEKFTVEFEAYFSEFCTRYLVSFYDMVNQPYLKDFPEITISPTGVSAGSYGSTKIETKDEDYPFWQRIAISFNIRSLKVFYGEQRTTNIPNIQANPTGITISGCQCHSGNQSMIRDIRIAKGHEKLYDRVVTAGKFTTNGIRFDVGKATLRPESMGVINEIYNMMSDHPELKFSVEGHTDSDGDEASNMSLSMARAEAVINQLVSMGIESDRFEAKGFGESKPIDTNNTPEGKANNRRVEFIKL